MPKKSAVSFTLAAAALLATSASPALAGSISTRSFQALPSVKANAALSLQTSRFSSPIPTPQPKIVAPSFGLQSQNVIAPPSFSQNSLSLPGVGSQSSLAIGLGNNNRFGGLGSLFNFFPPRLQQVIAQALGNAGPGGQQLCRLLGIPECQLPDSNG